MERPFCLLPLMIRSKYHPILYVMLFALMNLPGSCSILAGFIAGYLFVYGVLSWMMISKEFGTWFEEKFLCCVSDNKSFVRQN